MLRFVAALGISLDNQVIVIGSDRKILGDEGERIPSLFEYLNDL